MNYEKHLLLLIEDVCKSYNVNIPDLKFSGRLKSANGTCTIINNRYSNKLNYVITISKHIFEHYSIKTAEETLYHELAHYIDHVKNGNFDHGPSFKKLCVELGGTMNKQIAGTAYSKAVTADWVSNKIGYIYTCPCGCGHKQTVKRISKKMLNVYCCPKCRTKIKYFNIKEL